MTPDPKNQLPRLLAFSKPYRLILLLAGLATLISSGLGLVFPQVLGRLVDASFLNLESKDTAQLDRTVLLLVLVALGQGIFSAIQSYGLALVGTSVVRDVRRTVYQHLMSLSSSFFEVRKVGELTSRLTSDASTVQTVASSALANGVSQAISLLGSAVMMFVTNWRLALLTLVITPFVVFGAIFFGRKVRAISKTVQDKIAAANASAEEALTNIKVVQSFTNESLEKQKYNDGIQATWRTAMQRNQLSAIFGSSMLFIGFSSLGLVLWYGGRQALEGSLTPGALISFMFYALGVSTAMASLSGLFNQFQEALGASSRIFELLDTPSDLPEAKNPVRLEHPKGLVQFENVSFTYATRSSKILDNINLSVSSGEVIALVGMSGAGKSTLVNLIPRFFEVSSGRIMIDGVDIKNLALHELRGLVGIVPQETQLFSGSILENIGYGRANATELEIRAAALAANALEFIEKLESGFETVVGERGMKLSGGQRQRLAIARAILKNPRILVLDEATSSLDNESEYLVQEALERLMQHRTTFVIAHRLSTVRNANRIAVLEGGRISSLGSHEEMLQQGGLYKDLYDLQFRDAELVSA
jgi:ATP-binding cassette, subfamily B, bacterial MsbA